MLPLLIVTAATEEVETATLQTSCSETSIATASSSSNGRLSESFSITTTSIEIYIHHTSRSSHHDTSDEGGLIEFRLSEGGEEQDSFAEADSFQDEPQRPLTEEIDPPRSIRPTPVHTPSVCYQQSR